MDFEGRWRIARRIEDALSGQIGTFEGTALFSGDGAELRYYEEGILELGGVKMEAERVYLWRADEAGIAVYFEDGRPFHTIDGSAEASHWCDPDQYDVTYRFTHWPCWTSVWRVRGPRKDYVLTSHFQR